MKIDVKLNQKIYVWRSYGWSGREYLPGVVVKITPSGLIDVKVFDSGEPIRFSKDGKERGTTWRNGVYIDDEMAFSDRAKWVQKENERTAAIDAYNKIVEGLKRLDRAYSLETLKEAVDELKAKLGAIKY